MRRLKLHISLHFFLLSGMRNQQYQNNNSAPLWTGIKFTVFLKMSYPHLAEAEMSQHYTSLIKAGNFTVCCLANNYIYWKDLPLLKGENPSIWSIYWRGKTNFQEGTDNSNITLQLFIFQINLCCIYLHCSSHWRAQEMSSTTCCAP